MTTAEPPFFTADLHFNHAGVIDYCKRPFASVAEMNAALIAAWNRTVGPRSTVYVLGDFGFRGEQPLADIFAQLHGHKHLVRGNHDERNREVFKLPWESQHDLLKVRWNGLRAVCCHFPLQSWEGSGRGYFHFHGHCHGTLRSQPIPRRFDVGVDCVSDYSPMPFLWLSDIALGVG